MQSATHTHTLPQRTTTRLLEQRRHGPTPRTRSKGGTAAELLAADEPRSSSSSEAPQSESVEDKNSLHVQLPALRQ